MVEAEFGLAHLTGSKNGPPVKVGVAVTDLTTGLYAVQSILAALWQRAQSKEDGEAGKGQGQHLDVCLSDCQVATLANMGQGPLISGQKDSGRWGTAHRMDTTHLPPYHINPLTETAQHPSFPTNPSPPRTGTSSLAARTTSSLGSCARGSTSQNGLVTPVFSRTRTASLIGLSLKR